MVSHPARFVFIERPFPSANMALVRGEQPVLVDSGFGGDLAETERLLRAAGCPPRRLALLVNTHYHADHVGGHGGLQRRYGVPVAAHHWEAMGVNGRDPEACAARWQDQPVEPYRVDRPLADGDEVDAGGVALRVVHVPGHTLGHIALYAPADGLLVCGDALQRDDVAWLTPFREGVGALHRALDSLDRLAALRARRPSRDTGGAIDDSPAALDAARRRYESWLGPPETLAWHACKRIFAYALMIRGGLPEAEVAPYLLACPWFGDYSRHCFAAAPEDMVRPLLAEMVRSGAAGWRAGRLVALAPHTPPAPEWPRGPARPDTWPATDAVTHGER
jgi:glyoxylase-like metal-dependent hydrolase (beta-lactamase superfamily II)